MRHSHFLLHTLGTALDELEVALCVFDADDRTLLWNQRFVEFFSEHDGKVATGEHYSDNLRRFYRCKLSEDELPFLERYVAEGIERHRTQLRPFDFDHQGFRLRAYSAPLGPLGRARLWRKTVALSSSSVHVSGGSEEFLSQEAKQVLECIADGALIVDAEGCGIWANANFRSMYGIPTGQPLRGLSFLTIYRMAWAHQKVTGEYAEACACLQNRQRYSGAPYELPMPGDRWIRVIERRGADVEGRGCFSHVDITMLKRQQRELSNAQSRLKLLASTDGLTGLRNRAHFDRALEHEWRRATRGEGTLSLLMIDIDHFKYLNDRHGHLSGDDVLRAVAHAISAHARRAGDLVARFGGEEFVMLLPNTDATTAANLAQAVRSGIALQAIQTHKAAWLNVTVSIGVSTMGGDGSAEGPDVLVERADVALYHAKRSGRDRVASHVGPVPSIVA